LGSEVSLVEATPTIMPTMDPELIGIYLKQNKSLFAKAWFETKVVGLEEKTDGVSVSMEKVTSDGVTSDKETREFDAVLVSVGMRPNTAGLGLEKAGVEVDQRGFIKTDEQGRTNVKNVFAIGDVTGGMLLAHKASYQGRIAAEVIAGELQGNKELASAAFNARVIPSVAYTDPEVAWVGLTETEAGAQGIKVKKGLFPWTASGRAIANGRDEGLTKLLFDDGEEAHGHGKILGGGIVGTHAGDMIGEIALAIEMGADAVDIGQTIHAHPTLGESIGMAAEVAHGSCTDLPPSRK